MHPRVSFCSPKCQAIDWQGGCAQKKRGTDKVEEGRAGHQQGNILRAQHKKEEACLWYIKSLRTAEQTGDSTSEGVLHCALGELYCEWKLYTKALVHLRLGLKLANRCIGLPKKKIDGLNKLIRSCEQTKQAAGPKQQNSKATKRRRTDSKPM